MSTATTPDYFLTEQTFVCLTDGILVFLDLLRDNYVCLELHYTRPIGQRLGLTAAAESGRAGSEDPAAVEGTIRDMTAAGLITADPDKGKRAELIPEYHELREMLGYLPDEAPKVRAAHVLRFFKAFVVTRLLLRFASMERIVGRVANRKRKFARKLAESAAPAEALPDYEQINRTVEIYKILKPLFVTVKDQCLFNSLFLIEFLAAHRIHPDWYFGVRLNEFYAHCWVQGGNVVYDDFVQSVCQNRPIMKV